MTSIILQSKIGCFVAAFRTYFRNIRGRKFEPEIEFLKYVLKSGDICMHIGASDARHSYIMSTLIGDGEIYAFEPSSYSYQHLKLILKLHRIRNAHIYKKAVSDKNDVVSLVTPIKSSGRAGRSFAFITALDRLNAKRSDVANDKYIKEEVKDEWGKVIEKAELGPLYMTDADVRSAIRSALRRLWNSSTQRV